MAEQKVPGKIDLDELKEISKNHIDSVRFGDIVPIEGSHTPITKEAADEIMNVIFENSKKILMIASGIGIAKGKPVITIDEVRQAAEISERSIDDYLPEVSW